MTMNIISIESLLDKIEAKEFNPVKALVITEYIKILFNAWKTDGNSTNILPYLSDDISTINEVYFDDMKHMFSNKKEYAMEFLNGIRTEWIWDHIGHFSVDIVELPWHDTKEIGIGILASFTSMARPLLKNNSRTLINYVVSFSLNDDLQIC